MHIYTIYIIDSECVLPHLTDPVDKINMLVSMTRKLFVFASGGCCEESPDSPANQEVSLELNHVPYISTRYVLNRLHVCGNVAFPISHTFNQTIFIMIFRSLSLRKRLVERVAMN